jgi:hypothetical protein
MTDLQDITRTYQDQKINWQGEGVYICHQTLEGWIWVRVSDILRLEIFMKMGRTPRYLETVDLDN